MNEFLDPLQQFIVKIIDVRPNGNCGYKTIAT